MKKEKKRKEAIKEVIKHIGYFFLFSFLGWILEITFSQKIAAFGLLPELYNISIPFIPVYGFGGLLLLFASRYYDQKKITFMLRGLISGMMLTILELFSGLFVELVFGVKIWDYSSHVINFDGIISLPVSLAWVTISYIFELIRKYLIKKFF